MPFEIDRPFWQTSYKTIGMLWCPRCFSMREFVVPPESGQSNDDQAAAAECCECQYAFGYCNDEKVIGEDGRYRTERRPVLSPAVLAKAREERMVKYRRDMLASGVRLEVLDGRAKVNPT